MNDVTHLHGALDCDEALLALLGGNDDVGTATDLRRRARVHVSTCPRCARSYHDPDAAPRTLERVRPMIGMPSLVVRAVLVILGIVQVVVACPWLFGASLVPDAHVAAAHLTRDGAFGLAAAAAVLLAAWRPRYVIPALFVGVVVLLAQFSAGFVDQQSSSVSPSFEAMHALVLAMLAALAWAASAARRHDDAAAPPMPPSLHSL